MSVLPDKPKVMIVSDSHKSVHVQCSSLTWIIRHYMSRQAATHEDGATTQRSDVSVASTTAMRTIDEPSRIQTIFEPYTGNMVITPSIHVAPRGVLISFGSEFESETHTRMPLTDQLLNRRATMIQYRGTGNPPQDQIKPSS